MVQDGPRLKKLKEVYKKAIQEILKEEDAICASITNNSEHAKDSFYSNSSVCVKQEDIRKIFLEIKHQFSEALKEKIRACNLDRKLNTLDKDIKDGRMCYQDIRNAEYIKEIFDSQIADKKEELVRFVEEKLRKETNEKERIEREIEEIKKELREKEEENEKYEGIYKDLILEMENV